MNVDRFNSVIFFVFQRILGVQYTIPDHVQISDDCRHLISRIFVGDPAQVSPSF